MNIVSYMNLSSRYFEWLLRTTCYSELVRVYRHTASCFHIVLHLSMYLLTLYFKTLSNHFHSFAAVYLTASYSWEVARCQCIFCYWRPETSVYWGSEMTVKVYTLTLRQIPEDRKLLNSSGSISLNLGNNLGVMERIGRGLTWVLFRNLRKGTEEKHEKAFTVISL
jgi:hypothetical protein